MNKIIVDEDDNIIGYKPSDQIDYSRDIYRATTIWIENSQGEVLIAQRNFTDDKDPGLWESAAGGTVEEGETYESNIYKEAEEEIGVKDIPFKFITKVKFETPRRQFRQIYFAIVDWPLEKFNIQKDEVEQIAWIPKQQLIQELKEHPEKYTQFTVKELSYFK